MRCYLVAASVCCALAAVAPRANASNGWLADGPIRPTEQRLAIAVGPTRTVTWTSLRYQGSASVAIIVPAAEGSAVDLASDAWFEALEANTAPRVLPPGDQAPSCPGVPSSVGNVEVVGHMAHEVTTRPSTTAVLTDADAVGLWAAQEGLSVPPALDQAMRALGATRFVAIRFPARDGGGLTATVRVTSPGADAHVPLALLRAADADLLVTTFAIGNGRAELSPTTPASIAANSLAWLVAEQRSNYALLREEMLATSSEAALVESAGHDSLFVPQQVGIGSTQVDALVDAYFQRGAGYEPGTPDAASCASQATGALVHVEPVGTSCPAGDLAFVGSAPACTESSGAGVTPAAALRCGDALDDLAIGLEGMRPVDVWLTRTSLLVERAQGGPDEALHFPGGSVLSPIHVAGHLDATGCADGQGTGHGTGHGNGNGQGNGSNVSGEGEIDLGTIDLGDGSDGSCDGSSDTSQTSCDGSSSGSSSDSCSGSSDGGDSCDSSGGDSCDSGAADGCDSAGGDACSGGSAGSCDCTLDGPRTKRPRGSVILMIAAALLAPLRRRATLARRARRAAGGSNGQACN